MVLSRISYGIWSSILDKIYQFVFVVGCTSSGATYLRDQSVFNVITLWLFGRRYGFVLRILVWCHAYPNGIFAVA